MLEDLPMMVQTRGRLYTTTRHRRKLQTTDEPYGRGTPVQVLLFDVDRDPEWDGTYRKAATFVRQLQYYGAIQIPRSVRRRMGLVEGDDLRVTLVSLQRADEIAETASSDERSTAD